MRGHGSGHLTSTEGDCGDLCKFDAQGLRGHVNKAAKNWKKRLVSKS